MSEGETIEPMGYCQTCTFASTDGDYGQIRCCDSDDADELSDDDGETVPCPAWKPTATLEFCKKHKRWHWSTWEMSCPECYKEWETKGSQQ